MYAFLYNIYTDYAQHMNAKNTASTVDSQHIIGQYMRTLSPEAGMLGRDK